MKKGDFSNSNPGDSSRMWRSSDDYANTNEPDYECGIEESDSEFYIME